MWPRKRCLTRGVSQLFNDYCADTSIHGLKYVSRRSTSFIEKLFWVLAFGASLGTCSFIIHRVWVKWNSTPVIVSFSENSTPIWDIPFPAVTICSETKSKQTVFNYTDAFLHRSSLTGERMANFSAVDTVCNFNFSRKNITTMNDSFIDILERVAPTREEIFKKAIWKKNATAGVYFTSILTEDGICYNFNMLGARDLFTVEAIQQNDSFMNSVNFVSNWSLDEGYSKRSQHGVYPYRAYSSGKSGGLSLLLKACPVDFDYMCRSGIQGFKVALHNPAEFPRMENNFVWVQHDREVVLRVRPSMMTTSRGIKYYHPHRRQCYFPYERNLRFFKVYTEQNCKLECLTNYTLANCNCVALHMPRNPGTPICARGKYACTRQAEVKMLKLEKEVRSSKCDCIQACTSLHYDPETTEATYHWQELERIKPVANKEKHCTYSKLSIYFKDTHIITSRRHELYGITDFLANCGGLLGLCLGFSMLSLVELVYYFTLRVCCNSLRNRQQQQASQENSRTLTAEWMQNINIQASV